MRIIDLSAPILSSPPDVPAYARVDMTRTSHAEGAAQIEALLHVPADLLRDREGWAVEEFTRLGTHAITHVDAPWHYNSTIQGERASTIDELPLEWFFSDGVVVDMTHKLDGERVEATEIEAGLKSIGYALKPLDIVLVRTGRDASYDQPDYLMRGCAVSPEATRWLFERGIRVMGIDAWG
jgi:kynurenine formamidase